MVEDGGATLIVSNLSAFGVCEVKPFKRQALRTMIRRARTEVEVKEVEWLVYTRTGIRSWLVDGDG